MLDDLGRQLDPEEIAGAFGLKASTVKNNYRRYGGVKMGRRILFFEKLIVDKVRKEHALQSQRQENKPVESAGKETGRGVRRTLPDKGGSHDMGRKGSGRGDQSEAGTRSAGYDPLGLLN